MITRIVKLTIDPTKSDDFIQLFKENNHHIKAHDGCVGVTLLQDQKYSNIFFTYSQWEHEDYLNAYRKSEVFGRIWKETKSKFCSSPEAWTTKSIA